MELFVTGLHVVLCLFLILVVLLQPGKGADFGAALGGSSQDLIGAGSGVSLLGRLTALVAGMFMVTSLSLAYFSNATSDGSLDIEALEEERTAGAAAVDTPADGTAAASGEEAPAAGDTPLPEGAPGDDASGGSEAPSADTQAAQAPAGDAGTEAPAGDAGTETPEGDTGAESPPAEAAPGATNGDAQDAE